MQTACEVFKQKVINVVPNIIFLPISDAEWVQLNTYMKELQRFTKTSILHYLGAINPVFTEQLLNNKRPLSRVIKKETSQHEPVFKKFKQKNAETDYTINTFIVEKKSIHDDALIKTFINKGVRLVEELDSASPEKGYKQVKRTPGKSKVATVYNGNYCFYKPLTPKGSKQDQGRILLNSTVCKKLSFEKAKSIHFTATKNKIINRQNEKRYPSQNQLAGITCREVFRSHGCELEIIGNQYHWSHLIAFFLGGEQAISNLVAATAAANYNTLEIVEEFIAKKLIEVESIDIHVIPHFEENDYIPTTLEYKLSWIKNNHHYSETIYINPLSYRRVNTAELESIELARSL